MANRHLPRQIFSIDIETEKTRLRKVEESVLAVAGVVPYARDRLGRYRRGSYRHFLRDRLSEFHALLADFNGLILGHNVLDFDYRVLRQHMSLEGIIEKTLDLYLFLDSIDPEKRARLSLEVLARRNLNKRKLSGGEDIPALWRGGEVKKVLRRNERDCVIVAELWMRLVKRRRMSSKLRSAGMFDTPGAPIDLKVAAKHLPVLHGRQPFMTYDEWMRRLTEWGNARRDPKWGGKTVVEEPVSEGELELFHRLLCRACHRNFVLKSSLQKQFHEQESVACPFCQSPVPMSARQTLNLSGMGYWLPPFLCNGLPVEQFPQGEVARRLIRSMRYWWY